VITYRDAADWMFAQADRELDAVSSLQMESHLAERPRCCAALGCVDTVRSALASAA
jgi:hypothetical protein